ncbi:hypothetical protein IV203_004128 [Nitzschia inconspicua]|uniref:Uncharacterized protein n=1 Tax=Nitzschia inconspicua TaxID=303405 RepID=A0A9K3L3R5_9STRA|nr:hypothetical protein IV203_004128 [Nitzschia inconspicua]
MKHLQFSRPASKTTHDVLVKVQSPELQMIPVASDQSSFPSAAQLFMLKGCSTQDTFDAVSTRQRNLEMNSASYGKPPPDNPNDNRPPRFVSAFPYFTNTVGFRAQAKR